MAKFINPFTDTGFKIIFGRENVSNEILRQFLNALFENDPEFAHIEEVEYRPTERTRDWTDGKTIVYDIFCETSTGHKFIVEMQKNPQEFFLSRAVYYVSRAIADQGYKGRKKSLTQEGDDSGYWDYEVVPVVGVFFSTFFINGIDRKLVTHARLLDTDNHKPLGDYMRYIFIQVPAFDKTKTECETRFDQWMYNLTHMSTMETMQFTSHQDIFDRLANVSNYAMLSDAERHQYDYDLKKARDYHAEMSYARKTARIEGFAEGQAEGRAKGRAEGRAEGILEGRNQERLEIAKNLLKLGLSETEVSESTGLSVETLKNL